MAFINLSGPEVAAVGVAVFATLLFATYKVFKNEKGFTQILWLLGIYLTPPFLALVYLFKHYVFDVNDQSQAMKPS